MRQPLFIVIILIIANIIYGAKLKLKYQWNYFDYSWESSEQKQDAIKSGNYNASANILLDVDRAPDGRIFVTAIRDKGVPASLMTISNRVGRGGPLLSPYPSWSWYYNTDCNNNTIISVYRVHIKCNHLFVLDCGKIGEKIVCPPQLLIFDLRNDMLVKNITIPSHIANNKNGTGLLVTPLAHVRNCNHIMAHMTVFMADIQGYGLAIYNGNSGFCRIESEYMKPTDPTFTIVNQSFYLEDGILGMTVIHNDLYHAPLAGREIFKINMRNLRRCSKLNVIKANKLTRSAGTLSGQTGPIASAQRAIFFSNIPETAILCADSTKKFNPRNSEIIAQDSEKLQFPSGLKVTNFGRKLLIGTDRFQRAQTKTLNLTEVNFRILEMDIAQIRKETNCFGSYNHYGYESVP